ncbi:ATP-binding protein [Grimontia sp. NTOU-MAR1]|uniref:ATP-binding protein n=1 Tax=Grimontia sp. NTOU-MAR1 TaxID=3111011 RepID=UPI003FA3565F
MFTKDVPWYKTMSFKAQGILGMMLAVVVVTIVYVLDTTGNSMVRDSTNQRVEAQVETVAQSLGQLSNSVGTIALSLANSLSLEDTDAEIEKQLASMFRNPNIRDMVASGGFWPEPYLYKADAVKSSVFIAINDDGSYHRINDYNKVDATPYQLSEWYAPARYARDKVYWSRAYIDPYTNEPMVTCTVPMFREKQFVGAVTIDVKLERLQAFLTRSGEKLGGYMLMFDRGGAMMSFPEAKYSDDPSLTPLPSVKEIAASEPDFAELALVISQATQGERLLRQNDQNVMELAKAMVASSPEIDLGYAVSVASDLMPNLSVFKSTERLFIHKLETDPILDETTLVFGRTLPDTNWTLVGALPERLLLVEATKLKNDLFFAMALVAVVLMCITYVSIHFQIVRPMAKVRNALIQQKGDAPFSPIDYPEKDELGMLVSEFNQLSSNLVETRERAIGAARAKQLFLANISHEIRTPMNGILGAASLMQDEPMSGKQAEYLSVIAHSSRGLMSLINNILDFSKIESNHLKLEEAPFDLEKLGRYVRDLMLPTINDKPQLAFEFSYQDACPRRFLGDAHRIEQVMLNLVSNALKFTENGVVSLSISMQQEIGGYTGVCIRVKDTGVGIPPEKHQVIFDEFQQADASTTRKFGGSGLGLAITKQLIDLMSGTIGVDSKLGRGTEFEVFLPLQIEKNGCDAKGKEILKQHNGAFRGKHCLLVEDNAINLMIAEKMLAKFGFTVDKATDGVAAVDKARIQGYDIIFMDIQMPMMDGLEATRQIRSTNNFNQYTPIVAMTANVLKDDIWRCISNGMQGHIGKPLRENDIYVACAKVLSAEIEV